MRKGIALILCSVLVSSAARADVAGQGVCPARLKSGVMQEQALSPALLFPGLSFSVAPAVARVRGAFPHLIFFRAGEIARKHGVQLFWLSMSEAQLDALDDVLDRLTPEAKRSLPPIVVWPGLIMPYGGLWASSFPDVGRRPWIALPTLFSPQGFSWLLGHLIAQHLISHTTIRLTVRQRLDLEAYVSAQLAEPMPAKGPLDEEFAGVTPRWLQAPTVQPRPALFDPVLEQPWMFRWGGVTMYSVSVLSLAQFIGPFWIFFGVLLPLTAVSAGEFWVRMGLQSSFEQLQLSPTANPLRQVLRRVPYVLTRVIAVILLIVQSVEMAKYPDFSQIFEPFKATIGLLRKLANEVTSDADHVETPQYKVTQLVPVLPRKSLAVPAVGEWMSNNPRDWTEIYTFHFDPSLGETTRDYANPMTGASDPWAYIDGLSTSKRVVMRASELVGLQGVTWQLVDVQDPTLHLGTKVEMRFPDGRVFSWTNAHPVGGAQDTWFSAAPDQAALQQALRANGDNEVRVTLTAYCGITIGNSTVPLKTVTQVDQPYDKTQKPEIIKYHQARFQLRSITLNTPTPRQLKDRTPSPGSPVPSVAPHRNQLQLTASA